MKSKIAFGLAAMVGVVTSAPGIEPPAIPAPIPPQPTPAQAAAEPPAAKPREARNAPEAEIPEAGARAYLGVGTSRVPELLAEHLGLEAGKGVVVRSLDPDGPAARSGLAANDVITRVSGNGVGSHEDLRGLIGGHDPADEVEVDYIHRGDPKTARITLGTAPAIPGEIGGGEVKPLERLMLDGMPPDQAMRIREAIERNLKAFEGMHGNRGGLADEMLGLDLQRRMQEMLQEAQGEMNLRSSGTLRMLNPDGSGVEIRTQDGGKEVRILGKGGEIEWEGPYDTPQDREAVPPEFRDRIERLNLDTDFKGQGLRLRMGPPPAIEEE